MSKDMEVSSVFAYSVVGHGLGKKPLADVKAAVNACPPRVSETECVSGYTGEAEFLGSNLVVTYRRVFQETVNVVDSATGGDSPSFTEKEVTTWNDELIVDCFSCQSKGTALICGSPDLSTATGLLLDYLSRLKLRADPIFIYEERASWLQPLLQHLYDYWPLVESAVTAIKVGDHTITTRHSGRGAYDLRMNRQKNDEVIRAFERGEHIESITIIPPGSMIGSPPRGRLPKLTLYDDGRIRTRASLTEENLKLVTSFIDTTQAILDEIEQGKKPRSYRQLEDYFGYPRKPKATRQEKTRPTPAVGQPGSGRINR